MPRKLTSSQMRRLRQSVTQQENGDIKIFLVTFTQGDKRIYVCSQGLRRLTPEDYRKYRTEEEAASYESNLDRVVTYGLVSKGRLFEQAGFNVVLCDDSEGTVPSVQVSIPNIGRPIIEQIERLANKPIKVDIELIFAGDPYEDNDDVIMSLEGFDMTNIRYDDDQITGNITRELLFKEPIPASRFSPTAFPYLGW